MRIFWRYFFVIERFFLTSYSISRLKWFYFNLEIEKIRKRKEFKWRLTIRIFLFKNSFLWISFSYLPTIENLDRPNHRFIYWFIFIIFLIKIFLQTSMERFVHHEERVMNTISEMPSSWADANDEGMILLDSVYSWFTVAGKNFKHRLAHKHFLLLPTYCQSQLVRCRYLFSNKLQKNLFVNQ